jgi:hypothetical protein
MLTFFDYFANHATTQELNVISEMNQIIKNPIPIPAIINM